MSAWSRTPEGMAAARAAKAAYVQSPEGKAAAAAYRQSPAGRRYEEWRRAAVGGAPLRGREARERTPADIPVMTASGIRRLAPLRRRKTHLYVITCEPTGWLYVGLTTKEPEARFRQHMSGRTGPGIANALLKFGPRAFSFQVLHTYANPNEAAKAERALIAHLDLTGPAGMNTGRGGEGARRKKWIIEPLPSTEGATAR